MARMSDIDVAAQEYGIEMDRLPEQYREEVVAVIHRVIDAERERREASAAFEERQTSDRYYRCEQAVQMAAAARSRLRCFISDIDLLYDHPFDGEPTDVQIYGAGCQ